jgi:hypothetical protein
MRGVRQRLALSVLIFRPGGATENSPALQRREQMG